MFVIFIVAGSTKGYSYTRPIAEMPSTFPVVTAINLSEAYAPVVIASITLVFQSYWSACSSESDVFIGVC